MPAIHAHPLHDPRQAVRLRRFLIAAACYMLALVLLALGVSMGYASPEVLSTFLLIALVVNGAFYAAFRSGINRLAADPSLTAEQILAASACALYIVYHAGTARGVVLVWLLVIFMFGLLRLRTAQLLLLAAFALFGYGVVIWLLHLQDSGSFDLRLELLQWAVLGGALVWFAFLGGYISELRSDLHHLNVQLEERVRARTVELEGLVKELETFTYTVAHDLRTPLGVMSTHSGMMLHEFGAQLPAEAKRILGRIAENAELLAQLLDDLLAFARLGQEAVRRDAVDMHALATEALATLAGQEPGARNVVSIALMPACQGDAALLRQVWTNLLSNALKYSRMRAERRVEVDYSAALAAYRVRDNGIGFDMQYVDKLFTVFQRLHSDSRIDGTGVGLAIAARIVQRHGGRIWAEAQPDLGATFYFSIP